MSGYRLAVVSAGLGQPSATRLLADRLAAAAESSAAAAGDTVAIEVIELRPLARDLTNLLVSRVPSRPLRDALAAVSSADGVVLVTPIYNASFSGLFKLFVDAVDPSAWIGRPVLVAATGGTRRHALALEFAVRPVFTALRARTVASGVFAAAEDWASAGELTERINTAVGELRQLVTSRPTQPSADPYADPVPFARLLASS